MSFGKRLRELREEKKMTQAELGKIIGLSGRQIGNYEADKHFPNEAKLKLFIDLFNVSADYLFGLTDSKNYNTEFKMIELYRKLPQKSKDDINNFIKLLSTEKNIDTSKQLVND